MQAKKTILLASVPIAVIIFGQPFLFSYMDYPKPFCAELWNYNSFALIGLVLAGFIDLQRKMLFQIGDFRAQAVTSLFGLKIN